MQDAENGDRVDGRSCRSISAACLPLTIIIVAITNGGTGVADGQMQNFPMPTSRAGRRHTLTSWRGAWLMNAIIPWRIHNKVMIKFFVTVDECNSIFGSPHPSHQQGNRRKRGKTCCHKSKCWLQRLCHKHHHNNNGNINISKLNANLMSLCRRVARMFVNTYTRGAEDVWWQPKEYKNRPGLQHWGP